MSDLILHGDTEGVERYDWFPGLSQEEREMLRAPFTEAIIELLVADWLEKMRDQYAIDSETVRARLRWLDLQHTFPLVGTSLETWLGYGLVTNSLGDETFRAYVDFVTAPAVVTGDEHWKEITEVTQKIWANHEKSVSTILPHWYRHLLTNLGLPSPAHNAGRASAYEIPAGKYGPIPEGSTLLESPDLGCIQGVFFGGPNQCALIIARADSLLYEADSSLAIAHIHSHCDRGHVQTGRFDFWAEYRPGATPPILLKDRNYWYAEEVADEKAVSYLDPRVMARSVTPGGRRLLLASIELNLPGIFFKALLVARKLRRFFKPQTLQPGLLACGSDRHVYLIDEEEKKRWVCSKRLLYASGYHRRDIRQVHDKVLENLDLGPCIFSLGSLTGMRERFLKYRVSKKENTYVD